MSEPSSGQFYSNTQAFADEIVQYEAGNGIRFDVIPERGITKISTTYGGGAFAQIGQNLNDLDDPTATPFPYKHGVEDTTATFAYASGVLTVTYVSDWTWWYQGESSIVYDNLTVSLGSDRTLYFVYLDSAGTLTATTTPWEQDSITQVFIAIVYRLSSSVAAIGDERHSEMLSREVHRWAHETIGTRYNSELGGLVGTFGNTTFTITAGEIFDEDLVHAIAQQTTCRRWYRYTGGAAMTFADAQTVLYSLNGTNIQYDNAGTLTDASNQYYVNHYVYATNDQDVPIYSVIGQGQHATLAAARAETTPGFANISDVEWKLLYRVTYRNTGSPPTYVETADYRTASGVSIAFQPTDHGSLTGLGDDDHTQYVLHSLSTAANDFLVGSGSNTFIKKTLAETGAILEAELDHGNIQGLADDDHTQYSLRSILTTLGDIIYAGVAAAWTRLAGNTTATKKFLTQTGDGANSAAPAWNTIIAGDIPDLSATYAVAAKGVTNGDSHDHAGGDGAQIDHGGLNGLGDDDHTQYVKDSEFTADGDFLVGTGSGTFAAESGATARTSLDVWRFIDRGDPSAFDFTLSGTPLTTDGTWRDLDLSSIVPAGAKLVLFIVYILDDAANSAFGIRKNGNSNAFNSGFCRTQVANIPNYIDMLVPCDTNRVVEYFATSLTWSDIGITVKGWWV